MKARENTQKKRPCVHCGELTVFERTFPGPRGGERTEDCCVQCGENAGRRALFANEKRQVTA